MPAAPTKISASRWSSGKPGECQPQLPDRGYAGIYVVTARLPERDGEFEYHIKHTSEAHERIAGESELHEARR